MNSDNALIDLKTVCLDLMLSKYQVANLRRAGKLQGKRLSGKYFYTKSSVEKYKREREKAEQEKKARILAQLDGLSERPVHRAARMVRAWAARDQQISSEQKLAIELMLDRMIASYDAKYQARHSKDQSAQ